MRYVFLIIVFLSLNALLELSFAGAAAVSIWAWYVLELFENSNEHIAFREYIMVTYGMNYLFSPAFSYLNNQNNSYRMKLPEEEYFLLAIPGIFLLHLGLNIVKTSVFQFNFKTVRLQTILNKQMLLQWIYVGLVLRFINPFLPSDLAFLFYLLSGVRFVAAYGLYLMDRKKYKWHILGILLLELVLALRDGMFHDFVMWMIFFGLFWTYLHKPSRNAKLILGVVVLLSIYIIQLIKSDYRAQIGSNREDAGLGLFHSAVEKQLNEQEGIFTSSKTDASLTRMNQAWILASTANRMNFHQDFQGVALIEEYAKASFLPRFLAPDKLKAGDKAIFNKFSGHRVNSGTSMGLGFFADGYISYGQTGLYVFAFFLGLIFSLVFKLVEQWSKISPFFILLMFPILHYAVRPDCETQTIMGHIVKGIMVFGCLSWYYSVYFSKVQDEVQKEQVRTDVWRARLSAAQIRKNSLP